MVRQTLALSTAALLAGIAAGDAAPFLSLPGLIGAPLCGLLALRLRRPASVLGALILGAFLAGAAFPARWTAPLPASDLARILCETPFECGAPVDAAIEGELAGTPVSDNGGARLLVDVKEIALPAGHRRASGRLIVYLAGEVPSKRAGDRLRFRAKLREPRRYHNPGSADRPRALARKGIRRVAFVESPEALVWLAGRDWRPSPLAGARRALRALLRREGGSASPLLGALLLGERGELSPALRESYARAGVAHVLAVSGLHVALVALSAGALTRRLLKGAPGLAAGGGAARGGIVVGLAAAWGYAFLAGAADPAMRAALMASALAGGALLLRRADAWHALWLAAGCLAVADPARVFEAGVQLSFASVGGLLWCWRAGALPGRRPPGAWRRAGRWLAGMAFASIVATLATLPIQANVFGRVSLVAPLANLVVLPLLGGLVLPLLLLAAACHPVWTGAAALLVRAAAHLANAASAAATWFGAAPWSTFSLPPFTHIDTAAFYLVAAAIPLLLRGGGRGARALLGAGLVTSLGAAALHAWNLQPPSALCARFFDVGQGDAALIETPEGARMLVDAGPAFTLPGGRRFDAGERVLGPALRAGWIRRLDVLAVTHPDADHAGGARAVLEGFRVGEVWIPAGAEQAGGIASLLAAARRQHVPVHALARGDLRRLAGGTRVEVLGPPRERSRRNAPSGELPRRGGWNDRSLVLRVNSGGARLLLAGDIEFDGEQELIRAGGDLRADVLKVPHHGSDTSSHAEFLAAVRPRVAVISAGAWNRFGFPAPGAFRRLERAGARVFRTDRHGAITVTLGAGRPGGADFCHPGAGEIFVQRQRSISRKGRRTGVLFNCAPPAGEARRGGKTPEGGGS
ncbi:MAG: DNA internalization-related competence protein ComEC/Rec2 [Deltaproteobacteria bacterium]|nr:DNA internalization-related competence protein ComEC/Rec2 [Deltaproteobacteria bacterium]